jgi:hypothetical protein
MPRILGYRHAADRIRKSRRMLILAGRDIVILRPPRICVMSVSLVMFMILHGRISMSAAGYGGTGKLKTVTLLGRSRLEARGHSAPIWKVDFDDQYHTRSYISADEGRILERRNDTWRWFDLFWMLHTMDYAERDNFQ